jgi:hypothetical protein
VSGLLTFSNGFSLMVWAFVAIGHPHPGVIGRRGWALLEPPSHPAARVPMSAIVPTVTPKRRIIGSRALNLAPFADPNIEEIVGFLFAESGSDGAS